ncbi:MAG: 3-oxoacyl-[acyl-carrier-protein] reductase [Chloroflexi bacterium RBG_16_47_49]|nr:MAG: 3-oxoacyl-[acyl-carrier-protein] reductase [Chloroflexi bacterium RBG_16_47_49]
MPTIDFCSMQGRVAVVTGAARGIGRAIAEKLAYLGADVVIADMLVELAEKTADEIGQLTQRKTLAVGVNVTDGKSASEMIDRTTNQFGRVDILVNNAGITRDMLILRMEEADWDAVLDVNLKGVFNCSKAAIRPMMRQRYGRIVNISSVSGQAGQAGQTNYSASKAGIIGFTKALAREVASRQITVNAVAPGFIPTTLTNDLSEDLKKSILGATPAGRMGKPEEIAAAVAFLASEEAAYITGQVLAVDGGMAMM